MTRIQRMLENIRDSLADRKGERWTESRLLRLLDEAQLAILLETKLFKETVKIPLVNDQYMYDLPANCWTILRATFQSTPLALLTYEELDSKADNAIMSNNYSGHRDFSGARGVRPRFAWDDDTAKDPTALVYSNRNMQEIRVYPIPIEQEGTGYDFSNEEADQFVGDEVTGVVTEIDDFTFNSPFGIVVDLFDPSVEVESFNSPYGVATDISETAASITIWYIKRPERIIGIGSTVELPEYFDSALEFYVVSRAFDDDIEAHSMEKSQKALMQFSSVLSAILDSRNTDGVKSGTRASHYRGPFHD